MKNQKPASASTREVPQNDDNAALIEQVREVVRAIPAGRVLAYGQVGARCEPPISGYICGRILHHALQDVPWWRVVAKDGALPIGKRGAQMAQKQRALLESEGVTFENGCVVLRHFDEMPQQPAVPKRKRGASTRAARLPQGSFTLHR